MKAALFQRTTLHEPIHSDHSYQDNLDATDPAVVNTPKHIAVRLDYYRDYVLSQACLDDSWTYNPVTPELLVDWLLPCPVWKAERGSYSPRTKEQIFQALMTTLETIQDSVTGMDQDVHAPKLSNARTANRSVKKTLHFRGLTLAIEFPKGSFREGTDPQGTQWKREVHHPYGYIKGEEGADGDSIDCYVGPDETADHVFVVNQFKADGSFDEHKVLLGFNSPAEGKAL